MDTLVTARPVHELPALPYSPEALEPHIDARTMTLHHDMHHASYVEQLNSALEAYPELRAHTAIWLLRSARGLSQRAMAKKMGIARTYISKLEGNRCVPSPPRIRRIAGILEVSEYCLVALATVHNQLASRQ